MSNNAKDDDNDPDTIHSHIFMALNSEGPLPDTPERLIQQLELGLRQAFDISQLLYNMLRTGAPMVLAEPGVKATLAAIGASIANMGRIAERFMEAHGITPLDLQAEQLRIARELLDQHPDLPEELRNALLAQLAKGLERKEGESGDDADWPEILLPDSGIIH